MRSVEPFNIFSNRHLDRFKGSWRSGMFTMWGAFDTKIAVLTVEDAREMIDALQKFLAVSE